MDDLDDIRHRAIATLRLATAEIPKADDLARLLAHLESGGALVPTFEAGKQFRLLEDLVRTYDALAAAEPPEGFDYAAILQPSAREAALEAMLDFRQSVSFGQVEALLNGSWRSREISDCVRDLCAAMRSYAPGSGPTP